MGFQVRSVRTECCTTAHVVMNQLQRKRTFGFMSGWFVVGFSWSLLTGLIALVITIDRSTSTRTTRNGSCTYKWARRLLKCARLLLLGVLVHTSSISLGVTPRGSNKDDWLHAHFTSSLCCRTWKSDPTHTLSFRRNGLTRWQIRVDQNFQLACNSFYPFLVNRYRAFSKQSGIPKRQS